MAVGVSLQCEQICAADPPSCSSCAELRITRLHGYLGIFGRAEDAHVLSAKSFRFPTHP